MTKLTKVLIGAAVVAAGAIVIKKTTGKQYVEAVDIAEEAVKKDHADDGILQRIKRFVEKKVIKILAWTALHMEQIESASALIGLTSGAIGIATAIRDYKNGSDTKEQLDRIEDMLTRHELAENDRINGLGYYTQQCTETLNNNLKTVDKDLIKVGEKLGVKMLEDGEEFCA